MPQKADSHTSFIFDRYELDFQKKKIHFYYGLIKAGARYSFSETLSFPANLSWQEVSDTVLASALQSLHLIMGISYWKAYCPEKIEIKNFTLRKEQALFWNDIYTKGLGEFFYKNKIDFRNLISFPYSSNSSNIQNSKLEIKNSKALLLFGGGKDSLVSAELLSRAGKEFSFLCVVTGKETELVTNLIPKSAIIIKREIDPKLFELNKKGAYNGHVPISAIIACIAELAAILYGYRYIISSNERSANYGNIEYLGTEVNHQWSKSLEFEKMFQDYTKRYINPGIIYFSLLRPLYEVKILQIFTLLGKKYFKKFASCNANFRILKEKSKGTKWCNHCPKCVFVFTILSAFISKRDLISIFHKNIFENKALLPLFRELLGIKNFKPFECVGTPEEMIWAMHAAIQSGNYGKEAAFALLNELKITASEISKEEKELFTIHKEHLIPKEFIKILPKV